MVDFNFTPSEVTLREVSNEFDENSLAPRIPKENVRPP